MATIKEEVIMALGLDSQVNEINMKEGIVMTENMFVVERELIARLVAEGAKTKATKGQLVDALAIALQHIKDADQAAVIDQDISATLETRYLGLIAQIKDQQAAIDNMEAFKLVARKAWLDEHKRALAAEAKLAPVVAATPALGENISICSCGAKLSKGVIHFCLENKMPPTCMKCQKPAAAVVVEHKTPVKTQATITPVKTKCSICGNDTTKGVTDYSMKNFKVNACMRCQKGLSPITKSVQPIGK